MKRVRVVFDFDPVFDLTTKRAAVKPTYTVGMMMHKIRTMWLAVDSHTSSFAIFLFFKNNRLNDHMLQPVSKTIGEIDSEFGHPVFVHVFVKLENTFGEVKILN